MNAITLDLVQGSREWMEFRANSFGASEAPVMMGKSKYQTRTELLNLKYTGIVPDVDGNTQALFDKGHAAEIGGRTIAEKILGEPLSPVVMSKQIDGLPLSASLDGINFDGNIIFEHKFYSAALGEAVAAREIAEHYTIQMDQQLLISGAEKCLFMCSDGTDDNCRWMWYTTNAKKCDALVVNWMKFQTDLATHKPQEFIPAPKAEAIMALPAVVINVTGQLAVCNLSEVMPRFDAFLSGAKTTLVTDEDFANGEETAKFSRTTAKTLKLKAKEVVDQIASIGEAIRTMEVYAEKFDALGLKLEKLVKSEKESRKTQIVNTAMTEYSQHIQSLESETRPIQLNVLRPNFAEAIKGMKRLDKMHDAVDTALRDGKFAADQVAKDIRVKLAWCKETSAGFEFLFNDLAQIIAKPMEDFQLTVTTRINQHKIDEAAKLEQKREQIRQEEERKATAKAQAEAQVLIDKAAAEQQAELAAERAKIEAEARAKAQAEAVAQRAAIEADRVAQKPLDDLEEEMLAKQEAQISELKKCDVLADSLVSRISDSPTPRELISAIAAAFNVDNKKAVYWITTNFYKTMRDENGNRSIFDDVDE